jgi:hypothetical protein
MRQKSARMGKKHMRGQKNGFFPARRIFTPTSDATNDYIFLWIFQMIRKEVGI